MGVVALHGAFWGNEGKSKISAVLSKHAYATVRHNGGFDIPHTIHLRNEKIKLRQIPAGITEASCGIIGSDVLLSLSVLNREYELLSTKFPTVAEKLLISLDAQLYLPHIDGETSSNTEKFYSYNNLYAMAQRRINSGKGITVNDILTDETKVTNQDFIKDIIRFRQLFHNKCKNTNHLLKLALEEQKSIVAEGVSGLLLDSYFSKYPFNSPYHTDLSSLGTPLLSAPKELINILVLPCCATLPFSNKQLLLDRKVKDFIENKIDILSTENETYSWPNLNIARESAKIISADAIVVTKLEMLTNFEKVKLVVDQNEVVTLPGWQTPPYSSRQYSDLPSPMVRYLDLVEAVCGIPILGVSWGNNPHEFCWCNQELLKPTMNVPGNSYDTESVLFKYKNRKSAN